MSGSSIPTPSHPLQGRVAIVTGASGGIGREVSIHLASLGSRLVLVYATSAARADLVAAEINSASSFSDAGTRAITVQADVSDSASVRGVFDRAELAFGTKAHILVACAGILNPKYPTLAETSDEDWDSTFSVNAKGTFLCCREAANRLVRGGGGRIITFSSSIVGTLLPKYSVYTASNAAVETMTKILAKELKGTGITANTVAPGPIKTDLFFAGKSEEFVKTIENRSMGQIGEPKDVAPLVGFLATDAAEWINGQAIRVNGGFV